LYYRINVMSLELPSLRERTGDIPLLVKHFLGPGWEMDPEALRYIERYPWPGNVRQLMNALERAKIMSDGPVIHARDLPREITHYSPETDGVGPIETDDLSLIARSKIVEVLRRESGNKTRAAQALDIDRRKLYRLLEKYSIADAELH
jgi:DNA-binding NtrC family response regulator